MEVHLNNAGFKNITKVDLNNAGWFINAEDTVESVTIDGDSIFSKSDYFSPDAKVVITYH